MAHLSPGRRRGGPRPRWRTMPCTRCHCGRNRCREFSSWHRPTQKRRQSYPASVAGFFVPGSFCCLRFRESAPHKRVNPIRDCPGFGFCRVFHRRLDLWRGAENHGHALCVAFLSHAVLYSLVLHLTRGYVAGQSRSYGDADNRRALSRIFASRRKWVSGRRLSDLPFWGQLWRPENSRFKRGNPRHAGRCPQRKRTRIVACWCAGKCPHVAKPKELLAQKQPLRARAALRNSLTVAPLCTEANLMLAGLLCTFNHAHSAMEHIDRAA